MSLKQLIVSDANQASYLGQIEQELQDEHITPEVAVVASTELDRQEGPSVVNTTNLSFKKLISKMIPGLDKNYFNTNNTLAGLIYTQVLKLNHLTKETKQKVEEIGNKCKALTLQLNNKIILIGQKGQILKAKLQVDAELTKIGASFENLLIDKEYVQSNKDAIEEYLRQKVKSLGFSDIKPVDEKEAKILMLEECESAQIRSDIMQKIVWPKLKVELQKTLSHIAMADTLKNSDPYIKQLNSFAKLNNVHPDSVAYLMSKSPQDLATMHGYNKISNNLSSIISSINKYTDFANNNIYMSNFYLNLTVQILHKYLTPEQVEKIKEEKFLELKGEDYNLNQIEKFLSVTKNTPQFIEKIEAFRSSGALSDTTSFEHSNMLSN